MQSHLGYTFKDLRLLIQAFTHKSVFNGQKDKLIDSNERLEFLGDAVLDLAMTDLLMTEFSDNTEGDLTKKRASLVNETSLYELALELDLDKYIQLGKFEEGLQKNARILASAFEALLGAIYLDGGYTVTHTILKSLFDERIERLRHGLGQFEDFKTQLQEMTQKKYHTTPQYNLVESHGPEHQKIFEVEVALNGKILAKGSGKNKKTAEQNAAQKAMEDHNEL
jgi:ribonuclease III